jgi:hypothetical protein
MFGWGHGIVWKAALIAPLGGLSVPEHAASKHDAASTT